MSIKGISIIYKSEFKAFVEAKFRCNNKNAKNYHNYGGRGIVIKFNNFNEFFNCIGPKPSKTHSLDRIDNNGNYEEGNIRWATSKEQARNVRHNLIATINGVTKTLIEWSEIYGIKYKSVYRRVNRYKWDTLKALTEPIRKPGRSPKDIT